MRRGAAYGAGDGVVAWCWRGRGVRVSPEVNLRKAPHAAERHIALPLGEHLGVQQDVHVVLQRGALHALPSTHLAH